MPASHTTLYRLRSEEGDLLYVGIAGNPGRRFEQHSRDKFWWGEVKTIALDHFPSRPEALRAERTAIQTERPRYNSETSKADDVREMVQRWLETWLSEHPPTAVAGDWFIQPLDDVSSDLKVGQVVSVGGDGAVLCFYDPVLNSPIRAMPETVSKHELASWHLFPDYTDWRWLVDVALSRRRAADSHGDRLDGLSVKEGRAVT